MFTKLVCTYIISKVANWGLFACWWGKIEILEAMQLHPWLYTYHTYTLSPCQHLIIIIIVFICQPFSYTLRIYTKSFGCCSTWCLFCFSYHLQFECSSVGFDTFCFFDIYNQTVFSFIHSIFSFIHSMKRTAWNEQRTAQSDATAIPHLLYRICFTA